MALGEVEYISIFGIPFIVYLGAITVLLLLVIFWNVLELRKAEKTIRKQVEELKALDKAKDEFFNVVAHELLTPMIAIQGYSELMSRGKMGKINSEQKEGLENIRRSTDRLNNLIHDVVDFGRINVGKLKIDIRNIAINEVIENSVKELQPLANEKKLGLRTGKTGKLPQVMADQSRISQVLANLIKNAIKFTHSEGKIIVSAEGRGNEVITAVEDTGIGISEENIGKIFTRFYQADTSARRSAEGLGLGLAISKGIIDAHKGKIWVESTPGKGSTFYFSLPTTNKSEVIKR